MMLSILVAMDKNRVIGYQNDLPWDLPKDLRFFKEKTTGNTIVMGRKTYESIGRALPNRRNIVLTSQKNASFDGAEIIHDIESIFELEKNHPDEEIFIIGGANLIKQILPDADRMYITFIDEAFTGDTYLPEFSEEEWDLIGSEKGEKDEKNPYDYYFMQYDRK